MKLSTYLCLLLLLHPLTLIAATLSPEQTAELLSRKQFQPSEVTLKKPLKMSVYEEGKKTGELTIPGGGTVQCLTLKDKVLEVGMGTASAHVPVEDTDFLDRAFVLKQKWDSKSIAEKRAKLIADSPKSGTAPTESTPSAPAPPPPDSSASSATKQEPHPMISQTEREKILRFMMGNGDLFFRCLENNQEVAKLRFRTNGTFVLKIGAVGFWKLDDSGDLVTVFEIRDRRRVNRYQFDQEKQCFVGRRDLESDVLDQAKLQMIPDGVKPE
jgi:hypothetical protein